MWNSSWGELKENGFSARYPLSVPLAFKWEEELFVQGSNHPAWLYFSSVLELDQRFVCCTPII